jgi:tRNA pseudouridine38-40 synthase
MLFLEYDGTRYGGWQEQKNARTVMGELREAAEGFFGRRVEIGGAGRTDAGVHATGQVAHLRAEPRGRPAVEQILRALNEALPADIAVKEVREAPARFHARHDAIARRYLYRITRRKTAFDKKFVWWVKEPLDVIAMTQAAALLEGRHDFARFRAQDPAKPDEPSVVVVAEAKVEQDGHFLLLHFEASHFLWRMVRRLTGALVKVGKGELTVADFKALVDGGRPDLDVAAWTAPAAGLFLEAVRYRSAP